MKTIDLSPHNLTKPEKVKWKFNLKESVLSSILSKSTRKVLKKTDEVLARNNISYEYKELSEQDFTDWLYFYEAIMQENNFRIIASLEKYHQYISDNKIVHGLFFYQDGDMVGSAVFLRDNNDFNLAFKASKKISLAGQQNTSLGIMIDYLFLEYAHQQGAENIYSGRSGNAFGVLNTYGYLEFKLKMGYVPTLPDDVLTESTVEKPETTPVSFVAKHNDELIFVTVSAPEELLNTSFTNYLHLPQKTIAV